MAARLPDIDEILAGLRAGGQRITTARRVVLEALHARPGEHLTMDELAEVVNEQAPHVHRSTVYRTVEFLEQAGVLVHARLGSGAVAYHFASDAHHHARCDECGATVDLPADSFDPLVRKLRRDHGFHAHPNHIVITGLCRACAG